MLYEIAGVLATLFISVVVLWIVSALWSILNVVRSEKHTGWKAKWIIISIIPLGAAVYYFFEFEKMREDRTKKSTRFLLFLKKKLGNSCHIHYNSSWHVRKTYRLSLAIPAQYRFIQLLQMD